VISRRPGRSLEASRYAVPGLFHVEQILGHAYHGMRKGSGCCLPSAPASSRNQCSSRATAPAFPFQPAQLMSGSIRLADSVLALKSPKRPPSFLFWPMCINRVKRFPWSGPWSFRRIRHRDWFYSQRRFRLLESIRSRWPERAADWAAAPAYASFETGRPSCRIGPRSLNRRTLRFVEQPKLDGRHIGVHSHLTPRASISGRSVPSPDHRSRLQLIWAIVSMFPVRAG